MRLVPGAIVFVLILQCLVSLLFIRIVTTGRSRKMVHTSQDPFQIASPKIPGSVEPIKQQLRVAISKVKGEGSMVKSSVSSPQEESTKDTMAHLSKNKGNFVVKRSVNSIVQDLKPTMTHLSKNKEKSTMVKRSISSPQKESTKDTWAHLSKNKASSKKLSHSMENLPPQPKQKVREATSKGS